MLKTEVKGKRKSTRTIILEKIDEKSPFISKMKRHLHNYKFYGSETAAPRVVELEDQEELPMDPSDVPMNTNEQVPRGLNNNEPDLRDKLTRKATKRLLENPEVDAREIIEVKTAKKQRVVEDQGAREEEHEDTEVMVVPDSPVSVNYEAEWDSIEYVYSPETMKKRIVSQSIGRKEFLNQKFKAHSNYIYELTIDRERIRAFPEHSGSIKNYYKHLRGLRNFLSEYVAHIDELSANIFNGNLDDKEVADRRAFENPRRTNF